MRPPEPTLEQNNRWFHHLLTDGVDVEYRTPEGETRGDKAWLVDFERPAANDRLVVQQFTVSAATPRGGPIWWCFLTVCPWWWSS